jgi:hypothetical protein
MGENRENWAGKETEENEDVEIYILLAREEEGRLLRVDSR